MIICMFYIQVYIIRANQFTATDGAISLLNLEARKKGKLPSSKYFTREVAISYLVIWYMVIG